MKIVLPKELNSNYKSYHPAIEDKLWRDARCLLDDKDILENGMESDYIIEIPDKRK